MVANVVAFFSCGGPHFQTSLIYHLAFKWARLGKKVLLVDFTPQAHMTSVWLPEIYGESAQTIYGALAPFLANDERMLRTVETPVHALGERLFFLAGDPLLMTYENKIAEAWFHCTRSSQFFFDSVRVMSVLTATRRVIDAAAQSIQADVVLLGVGSYLNALTRAALIAADYLVLTLRADLISFQALHAWSSFFAQFTQILSCLFEQYTASTDEERRYMCLSRRVQPMGYVCEQPQLHLNQVLDTEQQWLNWLYMAYHQQIMGEHVQTLLSPVHDEACLAVLKPYTDLMDTAERQRKSIFELTAVEMLSKQRQHVALKDAKKDLTALVRILNRRLGLSAKQKTV